MPTMARNTDNLPDFPDHVRSTGRWLFTLADHFGQFSSTQKAMFSSAVRAAIGSADVRVAERTARTLRALGWAPHDPRPLGPCGCGHPHPAGHPCVECGCRTHHHATGGHQ